MTLTSVTRDKDLDKLTVDQIFKHGTYRIPIYQRAYAWTSSEIHTLLRDIRDARLKHESLDHPHDYYLGSLVVNTLRHNDGTTYEVVDGQQRLTTLFIILSIAPSVVNPGGSNWSEVLQDKLSFEGRERSQEDLKRLARDGTDSLGMLSTDGIGHAAELIHAAAHRSTSADANTADHSSEAILSAADLEYLLKHVRIVRTQLPPNTDLNHYFEVMNTRGEQLEKHEILKARLLEKLKSYPKYQSILSRIWDACTHLHRHIQIQFSATFERDEIFGPKWDTFIPRDSTTLFKRLEPSSEPDNLTGQVRLVDIIQQNPSKSETYQGTDTDEEAGSYGSIIDFPNFLLHVLKIKKGEHFSWGDDDQHSPEEIRLEDKYLLEEFDKVLPDADADWVLDFGWLLLKTRYLLDTYVIRTQPDITGNDDENWVIHRAHKRESGTRQLSAKNTFTSGDESIDDVAQAAPGRRVLMLQAMFQVTDTRRASKYFLFQTLQWLFHNEDNGQLSAENFAQYLETSAQQRLNALGLGDNLNQGTQVSNFIFNFLDYVLWLRGMVANHPFAQQINDPEAIETVKERARSFRFRYRTSVEHFYPVAPDESQEHQRLQQSEVDHFGNLCIMSRSDNSSRSNLIPRAKVAQYLSPNQSLKFQIMAEKTDRLEATGESWDVPHIELHGTQMLGVLRRVARVELSLSKARNCSSGLGSDAVN